MPTLSINSPEQTNLWWPHTTHQRGQLHEYQQPVMNNKDLHMPCSADSGSMRLIVHKNKEGPTKNIHALKWPQEPTKLSRAIPTHDSDTIIIKRGSQPTQLQQWIWAYEAILLMQCSVTAVPQPKNTVTYVLEMPPCPQGSLHSLKAQCLPVSPSPCACSLHGTVHGCLPG